MFHSRLRIAWSVHIGKEGNIFDAEAVNDDVNMNVSAVVMTIRMGTDQSLMSGKMFPAEIGTKLLSLIHCQTIFCSISRIKADDIVVTFHITSLVVFAVSEVGPHTGNCKIFIAAENRFYSKVITGNHASLVIQNRFIGKLIMLESEVQFGSTILYFFAIGHHLQLEKMKLPCLTEIKKSPFPATAAGFGEGTPQQVSDRGKMSVIRNLVPWSILALNK